jgi:hypothetical protein
MGLRYVLQFLFSEKHKIAYNSTATKAKIKISTYLESFEFFNVCLSKLKKSNKLATDFY